MVNEICNMRPAWSLITYVEFPIHKKLIAYLKCKDKNAVDCEIYITLVFEVNHKFIYYYNCISW